MCVYIYIYICLHTYTYIYISLSEANFPESDPARPEVATLRWGNESDIDAILRSGEAVDLVIGSDLVYREDSELHKSGHQTAGKSSSCKELLCLDTTPCRPMPLLVHCWRTVSTRSCAPSSCSGPKRPCLSMDSNNSYYNGSTNRRNTTNINISSTRDSPTP